MRPLHRRFLAGLAAAITLVATAAPASAATAKPLPKWHTYDHNPAAVGFFAFVKAVDLAAHQRNVNEPALYRTTLHYELQDITDSLQWRFDHGQHFVGASVERVLSVRSTGAPNRILHVCENNKIGVWRTKSGKLADKVTATWTALVVQMALSQRTWKVGSVVLGSFSCHGVK